VTQGRDAQAAFAGRVDVARTGATFEA